MKITMDRGGKSVTLTARVATIERENGSARVITWPDGESEGRIILELEPHEVRIIAGQTERDAARRLSPKQRSK